MAYQFVAGHKTNNGGDPTIDIEKLSASWRMNIYLYCTSDAVVGLMTNNSGKDSLIERRRWNSEFKEIYK